MTVIATVVLISPLFGAWLGKLLCKLGRLLECGYSIAELEQLARRFE